MSVKSYNEAKKLIEENKNYMNKPFPQNNKVIEKAEKILNVKFPQDYKMFLLDYGSIADICGILKEDFINSKWPDVVWHNVRMRTQIKKPDCLVAIYDVGDGEEFVLNYKMLNENGEPKVTSYWPGFDIEEQTFEVIANDFGDFLLDTVKSVLKNVKT